MCRARELPGNLLSPLDRQRLSEIDSDAAFLSFDPEVVQRVFLEYKKDSFYDVEDIFEKTAKSTDYAL